MSRNATSPYRYDRAAIRLVLETEGLEAARARWPRQVVDVIARVMGLTKSYRPKDAAWRTEWTPLLGTKPDSTLAGELGLPIASVSAARRKLGIPTCNRRTIHASRLAAIAAIPPDELASMTLESLGRKYGLRIEDVRKARKSRGVVPSDKRGRHAYPLANLRAVAVLAMKRECPLATLQEIGEVLGCTRERVRQILYLCEDTQSRTA